MLPTVLCLAPTHELAENIVGRLKAVSVPDQDISVVGVPKDEHSAIEPVTGYQVPDHNKQSAGVVAGAAAATVAALGTLLIPGAQAFLLTPVLLTAGTAAGIAAGATSAAATLGDFELPKRYRDHYLRRLQSGGGYLILVRTEDEAELTRARQACEAAGGQDVSQVQLTVRLA